MYINTQVLRRLRSWRDGLAFDALLEHPHSIPSIPLGLTSMCNFKSRGSYSLFWPLRVPGAFVVHKHTYMRAKH